MSVSTDQRQPVRKEDGVRAPVAPLLSIDDVATYLGVSPRWVYAQVRTGRLPAMLIARSWRIRREAVDEFAESFRVDATDDCDESTSRSASPESLRDGQGRRGR